MSIRHEVSFRITYDKWETVIQRQDQSCVSCFCLQKGQCCSDGEHCCPRGTECDVTRAACVPTSDNLSFPAVRRRQLEDDDHVDIELHQQRRAIFTSLKETVCPKSGTCNPGAACCRDHFGTYACCEYPTVSLHFRCTVIRVKDVYIHTFLSVIACVNTSKKLNNCRIPSELKSRKLRQCWHPIQSPNLYL